MNGAEIGDTRGEHTGGVHGETARPSSRDILGPAIARHINGVAVATVNAVAVATGVSTIRPNAELRSRVNKATQDGTILIRTRSSFTPPCTSVTWVVPPLNLVRAMSRAGRDGREIVTRSESMKAQNSMNRPGIQKWRALMMGEATLILLYGEGIGG